MKYTILWICDQIKYVILYKKRHVCVFSPSSGSLEQFWVKGTGVCSCCVTHSFLLPLCLRLILHGCVSCSDSRFPDARFLGDLNTAPRLSPPPRFSPGREAPAWSGSCTASPLWCLWVLSGPAGLPGGADWLWQSCWEGLVGPCLLGFFSGPSLVSLLPLWGHLPLLSLLSFLHPRHSGSGGSALQPHGDTTPFPWTLG